jgi:hypothetical protein
LKNNSTFQRLRSGGFPESGQRRRCRQPDIGVRRSRARLNAGLRRKYEWTGVKPLVRQHLGDVGVPVVVHDVYV